MHADATVDGVRLTIGPLDAARHAEACARMMCESEPWRSLGRTYERSLAVVLEGKQEAHVATTPAGEPVGLLLLALQGALVGYVRSIVVHPSWRSRGLGAALMAHAEHRIQRVSPNVFLMVSSFNAPAQRFYERLGYRPIGVLPDFLVRGHAEILMWKSMAPLAEWHAPKDPGPGGDVGPRGGG